MAYGLMQIQQYGPALLLLLVFFGGGLLAPYFGFTRALALRVFALVFGGLS
jgi:hypothetical protein